MTHDPAETMTDDEQKDEGINRRPKPVFSKHAPRCAEEETEDGDDENQTAEGTSRRASKKLTRGGHEGRL